MNMIEHYPKSKKFLLLLTVSLCATFALVVVIETCSYYFIKQFAPQMSHSLTSQEFNLTNLPAFAGTDDFEEIKKAWTGNTTCPPNRIVSDSRIGFPRFEIQDTECDGPENIVK